MKLMNESFMKLLEIMIMIIYLTPITVTQAQLDKSLKNS
jgi:hypothetical protein